MVGRNLLAGGGQQIRRALQRVFQRVDGGLQLRLAVKLGEPDCVQFNFRARQIQPFRRAGLHLCGDRFLLCFGGGEHRGSGLQLFLRRCQSGAGAVNRANDLRLQCDKFCSGQFSPRFGFGNWALVLVQDWQFERDAETPLAVPGVAGIQA